MHIIILLLSALAGLGTLFWWLGRAADGARNIADAAGELANMPRKHRFMSKARKQGLQVITDPREAATVLMLTVAREGGDVTATQKQEIKRQMQSYFAMSLTESEEMLAQAAWLSANSLEPTNTITRMVNVLSVRVGNQELKDLAGMMTRVAEIDGDPNVAQKHVLLEFRRRANLAI